MLVHGSDANFRHDHSDTGTASRANGTKQVRPRKPAVALSPWSRAALGPNAGQSALLANPGFVLEPDFNRPTSAFRWNCGTCQVGEFFYLSPALQD
jgi:hypothetical protein